MNLKSIRFRDLRNAEYFQYMPDMYTIFAKFDFLGEVLLFLVTELKRLLGIAEVALLAERRNDLVRQKNEADRRRDVLHSRLFNFLKYIISDDTDPRFDGAQKILNILKEAGNPTNLSENAQSAMMTALATKLAEHAATLEAINAQQIVDDMNAANDLFITVNNDLRALIAARKIDPEQASMSAIRKDIDRCYSAITGMVSGYALAKGAQCTEMITEMNVLIARFDALLAARKRAKKNNAEDDAGTQVMLGLSDVSDKPCDECGN